MDVNEPRSLDDEKELKVQISLKQHLNLHSAKVLTGKTLSQTVTEALEAYFEDVLEGHDDPLDLLEGSR